MNILTLLLIALAGSAVALVHSGNPVTFWAFQISGLALTGYASFTTFRATLNYFDSK